MSDVGELAIDIRRWLSNADDWKARGACIGIDPDLFFPERGASTKEAKEVCRGCEVRAECLDYAMINVEKFGIWGGLSERERRPLRKWARQAAGAGARGPVAS